MLEAEELGQELQQPGHRARVAEEGQGTHWLTHHEADVLDLPDAHVDALPVVDGQADVDEVVLVCHAANLHEGQEVAVVVPALGLHGLHKGQGAQPQPPEPPSWELWEHPEPVCLCDTVAEGNSSWFGLFRITG